MGVGCEQVLGTSPEPVGGRASRPWLGDPVGVIPDRKRNPCHAVPGTAASIVKEGVTRHYFCKVTSQGERRGTESDGRGRRKLLFRPFAAQCLRPAGPWHSA